MKHVLPYYGVFEANTPKWLLQASQGQRDTLQQLTLRAHQTSEAVRDCLQGIAPIRDFAAGRLQASLATTAQWDQATLTHTYRPRCVPELGLTEPFSPLAPVVNAANEFCPTYSSVQTLLHVALGNVPSATGYGEPDETYQVDGAPGLASAAFINAVYTLDIGGQYQALLAAQLSLPAPVAVAAGLQHAWEQWDAAVLRLAAMHAELSGQASQQALMLLGEAQVPASTELCEVALFGIGLQGVRVYKPASGSGPLLLYVPNAPAGALNAFDDEAALKRFLLGTLQQPAERSLLVRTALLKLQPELARKLVENVASGSAGAARLDIVQLNTITDRTAQAAYAQWRTALMDNAACLAVPKQVLTSKRHARFIATLETAAQQVLFTAAMLVPGCQPLAWGAVAVYAYGLCDQVYAGYQAWRLGDREAAVNHFFNMAANLAAGMVAQHVQTQFLSQLFVLSDLQGQLKLWDADLPAWQAPQAPHSDLAPGADGVTRAGGRSWVRVGGRDYPMIATADAEAPLTLQVPSNHEGVVPDLIPSGTAQWQWAHEHVLSWRGPRLLRGFDGVPAGLGDQALAELQCLAGVGDDQLRYLLANHLPLPALLRYWLRHRSLSQALRGWAGELIRHGRAAISAPVVIGRLLELAGWPQRIAVQVDEGGVAHLLGDPQATTTVTLDAAAVADGSWAGQILAVLDEHEQLALLPRVPSAQRPRALAERWAADLSAHAEALHTALLQQLPVADHSAPLLRQFPGLTGEHAQAIVAAANADELNTLMAGRVPPALGVAAAEALRELRVSRALEALAQGQPSDDRDRLMMSNLARLPGWAGNQTIVLRNAPDWRPALEYASGTGQSERTVVRQRGLYHVVAEDGHTQGSGMRLEEALYHLLPPPMQRVLANGAGPAMLNARVLEHAMGSWEQAYADLRLRPREQAAVRWPQRLNGQLGYPLAGSGRGPGTGLQRTLSGRLSRLFPTLDTGQMAALRSELAAQRERPLIEWVSHLEQQWQQLDRTLREWTYAPVAPGPSVPASGLAMRQSVAQRLRAAWRRDVWQSLRPSTAGLTLDLSTFRTLELPPLAARFSGVKVLHLAATDLGDGLGTFLAGFPNLLELNLNSCRISRLPEELAQLSRLERLSLKYVPLAPTGDMFAPLAPTGVLARPLHTLEFAGGQEIPTTALETLAGLPNLRSLRWDNAQGFSDAHAAIIGRMPRLQMLSLQGGSVRLTPSSQGSFSGLAQLRELSLADNPLTLPPHLDGLRQLATLDLQGAQLTALPSGLADLLDPWPPVLKHLNLDNNQLRNIAPLLERLQGRELADVLDIYLNDNPIQPSQVDTLDALGIIITHRADRWVGSRSRLRHALRRARGESAAAAFLDWVSQQVRESPGAVPVYRSFLNRLFMVSSAFDPELAAAAGFDDRIKVFRRRIYAQVTDMVPPDAWSLSRQLDAFQAAQTMDTVQNDDPFDPLLQHNYRLWQMELAGRYAGLADAHRQVASRTTRARFVDWLLAKQDELDQIDTVARIGEQDWRPYLDQVSPRWAEALSSWDAAGELLLETGASEAIDAAQLPAELVDHLIEPGGQLPTAFLGVGALPDIIEPVADVAWRLEGVAQQVSLNEDQYRRAAVIYRRVRLMVTERLAREITEGAVAPWWEPE